MSLLMSTVLHLTADGLLVSLEVTSAYGPNTEHGIAIIHSNSAICLYSLLTVPMAGSCHDAQVAGTWSTSDLVPGTTEATGGNVSAAAATTNKALIEAQRKLRISQQQV